MDTWVAALTGPMQTISGIVDYLHHIFVLKGNSSIWKDFIFFLRFTKCSCCIWDICFTHINVLYILLYIWNQLIIQISNAHIMKMIKPWEIKKNKNCLILILKYPSAMKAKYLLTDGNYDKSFTYQI
jgi:hypothetical protein